MSQHIDFDVVGNNSLCHELSQHRGSSTGNESSTSSPNRYFDSPNYEDVESNRIEDGKLEPGHLSKTVLGSFNDEKFPGSTGGAGELIESRLRLLRQSGVLLIVGLFIVLGLLYSTNLYWNTPESNGRWPFFWTPPPRNVRKAVVLASWSGQNVSWTSNLTGDWEVHRYMLDDPTPYNTTHLTVPRNQGREAMAYLTYIIDNYANLSDYTVFLHGHNRSWHQIEPTPWKLHALNFSALATEDYVSLRCMDLPGCRPKFYLNATRTPKDDERVQAKLMPGFWRTMFPEWPGAFNDTSIPRYWGLGPAPNAIGAPCCAQFAVTRAAIHRRPIEFWRAFRRPLERDLKEYREAIGEELDSYWIGVLYEAVWHMVFGKPAVYCPNVNYCRTTLWSGAIECNRYPEWYALSAGWENITCWKKDNKL